MDGRKTQAARERASVRFKGKKPNVILLTQKQMNAITEVLRVDDSQLITQYQWSQLEPILNINMMTYARRATLTGFSPRIGFAWDEYEPNQHSTKALVQIKCIHCDDVHVMLAVKMLKRRHYVQACATCYRKHHQWDDEARAINSAAQKIAQNRPETLKKHRENSRAMWVGDQGIKMRAAQKKTVSEPHYQANMSRIMRQKWASDVDYRDRVNGKGVYKHVGVYEGQITYHSKLELAFLLWCGDNGKQIARCDFSVPYVDPIDDKEHDYYPDFIIDDNTIVEVKGQRWIDLAPETYRAKIDALSKHCDAHQQSYRVVLDKDLKAYTKQASAYHEAQKQDNRSVQGRGR